MNFTPVITTENTETGEVKNYVFKKKKPATKKFCPKVGGYFYAVHDGQIKECRISSINPTHRPFNANWVKFRDVKTKKLHEAYLSVSTMALTKKQAKTQLVRALKKEFKDKMKAFKKANSELNSTRNELNKALKIKA